MTGLVSCSYFLPRAASLILRMSRYVSRYGEWGRTGNQQGCFDHHSACLQDFLPLRNPALFAFMVSLSCFEAILQETCPASGSRVPTVSVCQAKQSADRLQLSHIACLKVDRSGIQSQSAVNGFLRQRDACRWRLLLRKAQPSRKRMTGRLPQNGQHVAQFQ